MTTGTRNIKEIADDAMQVIGISNGHELLKGCLGIKEEKKACDCLDCYIKRNF